jgi:hypothetical protein
VKRWHDRAAPAKKEMNDDFRYKYERADYLREKRREDERLFRVIAYVVGGLVLVVLGLVFGRR